MRKDAMANFENAQRGKQGLETQMRLEPGMSYFILISYLYSTSTTASRKIM